MIEKDNLKKHSTVCGVFHGLIRILINRVIHILTVIISKTITLHLILAYKSLKTLTNYLLTTNYNSKNSQNIIFFQKCFFKDLNDKFFS